MAAHSLGSKDGFGWSGSFFITGVSIIRLGVSWTGGKPKRASCLRTRGSLTCFIGGPFNRLGVSTTGGLPNVALGLTFGAGVGDAGVVVAVVFAGCECNGGGSWVGIL